MSESQENTAEYTFPLRDRVSVGMAVFNLLFGSFAVFAILGALFGFLYFLWPPNFDLHYVGLFGIVGIVGAMVWFSAFVGRFGTLRLRIDSERVEVFEHLCGIGFKKRYYRATIAYCEIRNDRRRGIRVTSTTGRKSEFGWSLAESDKHSVLNLIRSAALRSHPPKGGGGRGR